MVDVYDVFLCLMCFLVLVSDSQRGGRWVYKCVSCHWRSAVPQTCSRSVNTTVSGGDQQVAVIRSQSGRHLHGPEEEAGRKLYLCCVRNGSCWFRRCGCLSGSRLNREDSCYRECRRCACLWMERTVSPSRLNPGVGAGLWHGALGPLSGVSGPGLAQLRFIYTAPNRGATRQTTPRASTWWLWEAKTPFPARWRHVGVLCVYITFGSRWPSDTRSVTWLEETR